MTKLSVNINKIATLRNARGGTMPNIVQAAINIQRFGAQGITVHPRPDERHIRYQDVIDIKPVIVTEFNIEGYPDEKFLNLISKIRPDQTTLVPDPPGVLTSNAGWDTVKHQVFLRDTISRLKEIGTRVSVFSGTESKVIEYASKSGADRIELYTEPYAQQYSENRNQAVKKFVEASKIAREYGLGVNAGHDLSLENLGFLIEMIPEIEEVSIGHALISDALYFGLENTVQQYLRLCNK